jgi:transposase
MATGHQFPHNWKEGRRLRAVALKQQGWTQRRIAEALGVSEAAVSQWWSKVEREGEEALYDRPHPGAPPKLSPVQLQQQPQFLALGAEAYGFRGEVWTCGRVATFVKQVFGVSYHKAHISRLLKRLEWTPQKPLERATQRDEEQVARWRTVGWPEVKKKPGASGAPWSSWMKRASISWPAW